MISKSFDSADKAISNAAGDGGIGRSSDSVESAHASGRYVVECFDAAGNLKWVDDFGNLVTTGGKDDALDKHLAGSGYTAAWYLGLIGSTGYTTGVAAGDTSAAHGGWAEDQNYSQATRPAAAFAASSGGSKALASASVFTMNAGTTIKGCFLTANSAKGGATGVLYSAGLFTGGDKVLQSGDTLNVSYAASL